MIGHHGLAEAANRRVTVADGHVAEDVVVGLVFLDDVDHVLDRAVVNFKRRALRVGFPAVVSGDDLGGAFEVRLQVDEGDRSLKVVRVAGLADRSSPDRAVTLGVQYRGGFTGLVEDDRGGEKACRTEALDLAVGQIDFGERVVAAVGDVQGVPLDRQGVGEAAEELEFAPFQWESPRDLGVFEVNLADRVARRAGDVNLLARDQQRRRMDADFDVFGRAGFQVDQADRSRGAGALLVDHDVGILALRSAVAGLGNAASPVADDQGPLVLA